MANTMAKAWPLGNKVDPLVPTITALLQTAMDLGDTSLTCLDGFASRLNSGVVSQVLRSQKNPDLSLTFFAWSGRHFTHNSITYSALIHFLIKHRRLYEAESVLAQCACKFADYFMACKFIKAYGDAGNVDEALNWFSRFSSLGLKHTVYSYNTILGVLVKADRVVLARKFFSSMRRERICPDASTYTILIKGFCRAGLVDDALRLFQSMERQPNIITYNVLINGLCIRGRLLQARQVFEEMSHNGNSNVVPDTCTYGTLINGFCLDGHVREAIRLLKEMKTQGLQPNVVSFNAVINGLCEEGNFQEARCMLGQMLHSGCKPDVVSYTIFIKGFCKEERIQEAEGVLNEMMAHGLFPNAISYGTLVSGFCAEGNMDGAFRVLNEMLAKGLQPQVSIWNVVVKCICETLMVEDDRGFLTFEMLINV